jgi:hypothetical protein
VDAVAQLTLGGAAATAPRTPVRNGAAPSALRPVLEGPLASAAGGAEASAAAAGVLSTSAASVAGPAAWVLSTSAASLAGLAAGERSVHSTATDADGSAAVGEPSVHGATSDAQGPPPTEARKARRSSGSSGSNADEVTDDGFVIVPATAAGAPPRAAPQSVTSAPTASRNTVPDGAPGPSPAAAEQPAAAATPSPSPQPEPAIDRRPAAPAGGVPAVPAVPPMLATEGEPAVAEAKPPPAAARRVVEPAAPTMEEAEAARAWEEKLRGDALMKAGDYQGNVVDEDVAVLHAACRDSCAMGGGGTGSFGAVATGPGLLLVPSLHVGPYLGGPGLVPGYGLDPTASRPCFSPRSCGSRYRMSTVP